MASKSGGPKITQQKGFKVTIALGGNSTLTYENKKGLKLPRKWVAIGTALLSGAGGMIYSNFVGAKPSPLPAPASTSIVEPAPQPNAQSSMRQSPGGIEIDVTLSDGRKAVMIIPSLADQPGQPKAIRTSARAENSLR